MNARDNLTNVCIQQLFERQVERTPDAVAIVFAAESVTYRELNRQANQLAHYLQSFDVGPEVRVGICVDRSIEMVVGLLGILKAGGAYLALDPADARERLRFTLEDTSVPVLVTQSKYLENLPSHQALAICLDSEWEKIASHSNENPSGTITPYPLALLTTASASDTQNATLEGNSAASSSAIQKAIAQIWTEVLNLDPMERDGNFSEGEGNSAIATQIISRMRETFPNETYPLNSPGNSQTFYPLSLGQQALWFLYQVEPESVAYNIFETALIRSPLDISALQRAWQTIVNRHPILRTTYTTSEGKPFQLIHEEWEASINVTDASNWSEDDLKEKISLETNRSFNLEKEAVWRANLFKRSAREYIFLLTIHHIACDSWSGDLIFHELGVWYAVEIQTVSAQQIEDSLPKNFPYTNFVQWQSEMLASPTGDKHWAYWKNQLAGELPILNLPADKPRPPVQTYRGKTQILHFDKQLLHNLRELAQSTGTSLYKLMLAAFFGLLYRYTKQEDILLGTPMLGRSGRKFKGIVGYFVNSVVLRASISGNLTFSDLLARIASLVKEAQKHQDYPFPLLVEQLQPDRDPSRSPLFQVSFTWQKQRWWESVKQSSQLQEAGFEMEPYPLGHQQGASVDLNLMMMEVGEILEAGWQYNTDLFEDETIARMMGHFQTLLEAIVIDPEQRICELPLMTQQERQQLLLWNQTHTDYPRSQCIHELFEGQVERTPDAVAVVFEGQQLTYRELNARANQLAHYLQSLGVGPEILVGLCVKRSLEAIVGLLGILKAGGAYVPIDPAYPSERIAYMLDDSQLAVLLTQEKLLSSLPQHQTRVVCFDAAWEEISKKSAHSPITGVKPENLAYVIYTSGSTGKPKGVQVAHQGLCNLATAQIKLFEVNPDSRVLQFASLSFDASISEIVIALCSGAKLYLGTSESLQPGQPLLQLLQEQKITHVTLVPSALAPLPTQELTALQTIVVAGEPCSPNLVAQWASRRRFFNAYGPTESTVCATVAQCFEDMDVVPIGRAIANTQVYILDDRLQQVPIGVAGELYIGGDGLARGYLHRPDITADRFLPNPFSNEPGVRLYKTGDLARYLRDGKIEFIGRIDNQVKIRGFRIELGEIELALSQHPSVKQTVVLARENNTSNKQLIAYIVTHPEAEISTSDLRYFLKQKLPDYMIPAFFITLETLPLTPNGKIDRFALPKPETAHQQLGTDKVLPQTATQERLATIWEEVLQIQKVGIHDNFFELGGDSILSIQIISRCHQANLQLTPKDLFQHQTIAELAQVVTPATELAAEQGLVTGRIPLSPIQRWFVEQNLTEPHHFNQSFLFEISPEVKPEILQQIFQELLLHHDALRLRLTSDSDTWELMNAATEDSDIFSTIDLSNIAPSAQIREIETRANQLQTSLNLSDGPIVRATLFDLGDRQPNRLLVIIHHLAVDGVSWRILLEDLSAAYQQLTRGGTVQLPAKTTSFKEWAIRLAEYAQTQTEVAELNYWLTQLDSKISSLPVDYSAELSENCIADTGEISVSLSTEQTTALLKEVPSAYNTQINDILLTALVQSFADWTGKNSLLVDLEGHGREELFSDVNLSRTVGWFTTVFPVLLELEEPDSPGTSVKSIKEQLRRIPQRGIGYGIIRYLSEKETIVRQLQDRPQAQVSFNYLGQFDQMLSVFPILGLAKESSGSPVSLTGSRFHWLEINGFVADGKLQIRWSYNMKIHQSATIERLANRFIEALTEIISHCLSPEAGGYTPTDFPDVDLTQAELDDLVEFLS